MPWDRVHDEAEVLEHVLSEELEELIAAKLGHPTIDPHGDPIPTADLRIVEADDGEHGDARGRRHRALRARLRHRPRDAALPRRARHRPRRPLRGARQAALRRADLRPLRRLPPTSTRSAAGWPRRCASRWARERPAAGTAPTPPTLPAPTALRQQRRAARLAARPGSRCSGPAFVACIAYVDPGNFATNIAGGAQVRLPAAVGAARGQPDGHADPEPLGEDRHRDRARTSRSCAASTSRAR